MSLRSISPMITLVIGLLATAPAVAGLLLVANKSDNTVDLLDTATGQSIATLPTGVGPHEIALSPDGSTAVVSNYGDRDHPGSTLTVIDVPLARVLRTIDLQRHSRPHGLIFTGAQDVVVTAEGSQHLLTVDVATGSIRQAVETGQEVSHMVTTSADGQRAFVANIGSNSVTVIDLERGEKIRDIPTGDGAEGIALAPDGAEVWVGNRGADTLSVIDPETLEIMETLACPGFPIRLAFSPDGRFLLVSAARSGEVVTFDREKRLEIHRTRLDLGNAPDASRRLFGDRFGDSPVPVGLVIAPAGDTAWIAATQADAVVVVDPRTLTVRDLWRAGREPDGMAWSPANVSSSGNDRAR